jgi:hypothetical protein
MKTWRCRRYPPPKRQLTLNGLHYGIPYKTQIYINVIIKSLGWAGHVARMGQRWIQGFGRIKVKAITVTGCGGDIGLWDVEAPIFPWQSAQRWRRGCQPYAPAALCLQEDSWYSFLLEAESTDSFFTNWKKSQSQGYFTTGGLPPISSSWRQTLWDSRPEIFLSTELLR